MATLGPVTGVATELTPKTKKPRRTNRERTAETRAALLDATISCLFDLGYARTTTTVVCRRAGVSRGAQLHHFPTKASLVTSALTRLFEKLHDDFRRSLAALPPDADRNSSAIDLLWRMVSGRMFYAWLELLVASRTDAELRESVTRISEQFGAAIQQTYRELFADSGAAPQLDFAPEFVFSVLEGLALHEIAHPGDASRVEQTLGFLKLLSSVAGRVPDVAQFLSGQLNENE